MIKARLVIIAVVTGIVIGTNGLAAAQGPPAAEAEQIKARQRISMMEGVLERAVSNGADNLIRRVRAVMPDMLMLTGNPEVRGFRLDGYGVFFDVEVPALRRTVAWTLRTMVDGNGVAAGTALAQLKAHVATVTDPRAKNTLEDALRRLELQVGPAQPVGDDVGGAAAVTAQAGPPAAALDRALVERPDEAYTSEVKQALVEAMLENSGPLSLGDDEWLTVAARDNERPSSTFGPDVSDLITIVLRLKGSDLAAFRGGRLSFEEAAARVEIREF
ncbi:MAG: hypothetical protein AB7G23_18680 [Vicinamibacterales bacterium]